MERLALMPKYESYKESGAEWLGDIPDSWELLSNKHIFTLKKKLVGKRSADYDLLSLTLRGIIKRDMDNPEGKFPAEFNTYQEVNCGDFVFCLFDVEETPRTVGLSSYDGMITGAYTVFQTNAGFDNKFLYYFYLNLDSTKRLKPLYRGLRNTIPKDSFMSFKTFVPLLGQQTLIANFLDKKTEQIDEAIAIKEKQISLLKERKQIIIQQAVTQGLDPNVPMKDSGVDWIGKIPVHWDITKISNITNTTSGSTPQSGNVEAYYNGNIPWVRTTDLNDDLLFDTPEKITYKALRETSCKLVPEESVCVAMYGGAGTIGKHALLKFSGTVNQAVCAILPCHKLVPNFLYYYVKFYRPHWMIVAKGSRVDPNISQDQVRRMPITLPSILEQTAIVDFINDQLGMFNDAEGFYLQQIEKLKEYKTTLINSAVTGKIKITPEMVEQ
ncbi:restriction endonuclease subunit S [Aliidiomarina quisquiliarum]|uniref:restriction endonuclease subunit S n=1 Tax=Aliidiomarina quisquiliarum TaxID=2938947 RepID=UPI00208F62C0|nr:restriction endonuclease subunit S [Aliidiomarina quisquiliarum]MCO4320298.1 restriction endonuclease subunit S [Aliidiomarina quisquiliarum]